MAEPLFFLSVGLVAYTFVGYPALIWLLAKTRRRPVRRGDGRPRVALVIVAFNEATRIRRKLESCLLQSYPRPLTRIVVASDGSLDATAAVVREFAHENVTLLEFPARRGKASCLNDAIATCDEEVLVLTDARQRLDPHAVESLVSNFSDPDVGAASGELRLEAEGEAGFGESVDAYWRYEKFIRRSESAFHSTVGATGALYALRRSSFRPIPPDTILDDVLIPLNVVFAGRRVVFDHEALAFDERTVDISRERARKVRTLAGNFQLVAAHPRFLNPWRNPVFFQLVSHKLTRLCAPYALLVALASSVMLSRDSCAWSAVAGVQFVGYGLGVLGLASSAASGFRLIRLATAFVSLNWFAVLGLVRFVSGREIHLWNSRPNEPSGVKS